MTTYHHPHDAGRTLERDGRDAELEFYGWTTDADDVDTDRDGALLGDGPAKVVGPDSERGPRTRRRNARPADGDGDAKPVAPVTPADPEARAKGDADGDTDKG